MLMLLSPSKRLDFDNPPPTDQYSEPEFLDDAEMLVDELRDYDVEELGSLMDISKDLSELNYERYREFETPFTTDNAKQAITAYDGDVYRDFDFDQYDDGDFDYLQDHVRIISGLYGILRPLDLIQPYRLEMGTKLENPRGDDLYEFWGNRLTESVNAALDAQEDDVVLNLASNEYFDAVDTDDLDGRIISPSFKDYRSGRYMVISVYLKRLRGTMTDWVVRERITDPDKLPEFDLHDYSYDEERSTTEEPVYLRDEQ